MTALKLNELPVDVQISIFEAVWENSPSSAVALAATCRSLNDAGTPSLYRYLIISIDTPEKLLHDVGLLRTTNTGSKYLRHTRHLKLIGNMDVTGHSPQWSVDKNDDPLSTPGAFFTMEDSFQPGHSPHNGYWASQTTEDYSPYIAAWIPLIRLLESRFQHLEDIFWEGKKGVLGSEVISYPHIAPSLISTLHQHHPRCRLHLRGFRFLTLDKVSISSDEVATICSPCLCSLSTVNDTCWNKGYDDKGATTRVLTLAPGLRHFAQVRDDSWGPSGPETARYSTWNGFNPNSERKQKAMLQSLTTYWFVTLEQLEEWNGAIEFTVLESFNFRTVGFDIFNKLALEYTFSMLKDLRMELSPLQDDKVGFESAVVMFITGLRPLDVLRLSGSINYAIWNAIIEEHGASLKELVVRIKVDCLGAIYDPWQLRLQLEDFQTIGRRCPRLRTLGVPIQRAMGDYREAGCYYSLGQITRLREIQLFLNCSPKLSPDRRRELQEYQTFRETVEQALMNCAVDETLARSIWKILTRLQDNSQLTSLSIVPEYGEYWGILPALRGFHYVIQHTFASYIITRRCADLASHLDIIVSKSNAETESEGWWDENEEALDFRRNEILIDVMQELWGRIYESYELLSVWKGFPLLDYDPERPSQPAATGSRLKQSSQGPPQDIRVNDLEAGVTASQDTLPGSPGTIHNDEEW